MLPQCICRRLSGILCALALLVLAPPLQGQEPPPFRIILLDLNTRIARGTLPFKEPFYMIGAAPAGARKVEVVYRESTSRGAEVDCANTTGWSAPPAVSWLRAEKADSFYASMPELSPNRMYDICVRSVVRPVGDALTTFRRDAALLLDEHLRHLDRGTGPVPVLLSDEQQQRIKIEYVRALSTQTGRTVLADRKGTIFDTTTTHLPKNHFNVLADIVTAQDLRDDEIEAFDLTPGAIPGADDELIRGLLGNDHLTTFAEGITRLKRLPGVSGRAIERAASTALYVRDLHNPGLKALLRGEARADQNAPRTQTLVALKDVWSAEELDPRAANLDFTADAVRALRAAVSSVRGSASLRREVGWSERDATGIFAGLEELLFAVEKQQGHLGMLRQQLAERDRLIELAAGAASSEAQREVSLAGSSVINFEARAKSMVSADIGLAVAYGVGVVPYFGANFYFEPVNKAVPLRFRGKAGDRVSFTLGVTTQSVEEVGERDDLFGSFGLLLGGGYRFADPLRLTGGALLLREVSDNPLDDDRAVRITPFVSLSLDWDVRSTLGRITDKLF